MLLELLRKIPDPRRAQGKRYSLDYILLFSIFSLLTGGKSYRDVHRFIKAKRTKLNELFELGWKKAPSKSMLAEVLPSLSTQAVEQAFRQYAIFLSDTDNIFSHGIDGKVLKDSFDNAKS